MSRTLFGALLAATALSASGAAATTLTSVLNVDNQFQVYLSTDDSVQGTSFGSGTNWPTSYTHSTTLVDGVTNYLHIAAQDVGGVAGLLGSFSLSDSDFSFSNGTQSLLSGDAGLRVSETGWGGYTDTTTIGTNGIAPWGFQSAHSSRALWVWSDDNLNDNNVYFSVEISFDGSPIAPPSAVPLPAGFPLLLAGLGVMGWAGRRRAK